MTTSIVIPPNVPAAIEQLPDQETLNKHKIRVLQNYIDGQFVNPKASKYIADKNPATDEIIAYIPRSQADDVDDAVKSAHGSVKRGDWSTKMSAMERAAMLDKIANKIEEKLDEFALLESMDTGKPLELAKTLDIPRAIANFRYHLPNCYSHVRFFAGAIRHEETGCHVIGGMQQKCINYTLRQPVGVCGLITPWK